MKNRAMHFINALSLVIAAAAVNILPDTIPVHYGFDGKVDRYGSKFEIFLFPAVLIILSLVYFLINRRAARTDGAASDERSEVYSESNARLSYLTFTAVGVVMTALECAFAVGGYEGLGNINEDDLLFSVICVCMGALFVFLGNIMPKMKMNGNIGLRTPWSMKNDEVWARCQRMGGTVMFFGGIAIILSGLMLHGFLAMAAMTVIFIAVLAVSVGGSQRIYSDWEKEQQ